MAIMKYKTKVTLYNSYFDYHDRITTKSILNIFQDVASVHAEDLGVGYQAMLEKNLYWILSRIKIDILKMPQINQTVIVETWPHVKGRIDFDRDLKILSEDGDVLIIGTSKWCVIDTQSRTLQRTDNVNYIGEYCTDVNYEERFGKIMLPEIDLEHKFDYAVMFSDLDHNKHMNNTNYANLIVSSANNKQYSHFEINFNSECVLGDSINVLHATANDGEYVVGMVNNKTSFVAYIK